MKLVITERAVRQALARLHAQGKLVRVSPGTARRRSHTEPVQPRDGKA